MADMKVASNGKVTSETADSVPVKSAWYSKINWMQGAAVLVYVLNFASTLTVEQKIAIGTTWGVVHSLVTVLLRTKFNYSVTPGDVLKATLAARAAFRK